MSAYEFTDPRAFAGNLRAALRAASTDDETRPGLCGVRIELDGASNRARFVATNGHWIWINETRVEERVGVDEKHVLGQMRAEILVSVADTKRILKMVATSKKAERWVVALAPPAAADTAWCAWQLSEKVVFEPSAAAFPRYATVLPAAGDFGGARVVPTFDATYLTDIIAALRDVGSNSLGQAEVSIHTMPDVRLRSGQLVGQPIAFTAANAPEAIAVLMPMRSDRRGGGVELLDRYRR